MEETMGKRIAACRKQLGLTQDALAEQRGVTAQAVSKWENDQSCPDITMIPKLARLFSITTDELLGVEQKKVYEAQVVEEDEGDGSGITINGEGLKMNLSGGRKGTLGLAVWILLTGALLLASNILGRGATLWGTLWSSALFVFGIFGLWPKFSFLRLGCAVFGAYFMLDPLELMPLSLNKGILLPVLLLLLGLSLFADALKKKRKGGFSITHGGKKATRKIYHTEGERFECSVSFGELDQMVMLPRLSGGSAEVSFGELRFDLSGCEEIVPGCPIDVSCAFGELTVRVPRDFVVEPVVSTSFGSVETKGSPRSGAAGTIVLNGSVSFGELCIEYI